MSGVCIIPDDSIGPGVPHLGLHNTGGQFYQWFLLSLWALDIKYVDIKIDK